jgi:valyl-tRNA synthetase
MQKITEKIWNPSIESIMLKAWNEEQLYQFDANNNVFVIDTPPPYPSGRPWHIGAAAHYSQIDMIARTARMKGHNVLFPIGIDRNGLPVEIYTEKKYKIKMKETDREEFLKLCKDALDDLEAEMLAIMKRLGLSCNFNEYYRTDSEEYRALTQATFIALWKQGLIYESTRPNNYCPVCGTTIADAEILYEDIRSKLVYIKFKILDEDKDLIIATTRPELLCACRAVIVNPDDDRYKEIHYKSVTIPIYDRVVKVIPHNSAKPEFGSGVVMVCSYGDQTDVQLFRELALDEIIAITEDGKMSENAGKYAGMSILDARNKIIDDLKDLGLIVKEENIIHRTPICERSKNPIEIIPMREYYLKQIEFIPALNEIAKSLKFYPEMHRNILLNWLNSITIDWPISRRRYYGTEIPIWYCKTCNKANLPEEGKYYRPWKDNPPFHKCKYCNGNEFIGETRTFDTWMDSSITPLFISKYKRNEKFFNIVYPTTLRPQAKDIVRTWLHYTILRCYQLTNKAPFTHAWIMGYGLDEQGMRMSKSKGNVIDPYPIIEKYGSDTFRFWSASEVNLGYDFRCSEQRIAGAQKFMTKLWNIARFISSFPIVEINYEQLKYTDKWILAELSNLIDECMKGYIEFNFYIPSNAIREFTWNIFAAHYIEMVKPRAYGIIDGRESTYYTLHKCLSTILLLSAPITPFITDYLWRKLYDNTSIHLQLFPKSIYSKELSKYTKDIIEFNSYVWNSKKSNNKSLKDPISIEIPDNLSIFKEDLIVMHNITI